MHKPGNNYYYPFGSPMQTRNWSSGAYRFGFNGKEKDDEINVDGGSYDFGARIYDGRLGRWMSVDPHFMKQADQSSYKALFNNPLIFIDPNGKDEFLIITTINKADNTSTIRCIKISTKFHEVKVWGSQSYSTDDSYHYEYYNTFTSATLIINEDGTQSGQNFGTVLAESPSYSRHPLFRYFGPKTDLQGKGSKRPGGVHLTTDEGGEMPSKIKTTKKDINSYNITVLMDVLGLKNPEINKSPDLTKQFEGIIEKSKKAQENYNTKKKLKKNKDDQVIKKIPDGKGGYGTMTEPKATKTDEN